MEKTTHITIASTSFQLTEAAYEKLHAYLESLKAYFAGADRDEILRDIEARLAEKFLETKKSVISTIDVGAVIEEIGTPAQFAEAENEETPESSAPKSTSRKLYRDMDNAWIAGVAAGLAKYFDIDVFWFRLAFLISLLFGGTGILLYIVLWILIPEAKTSSQKLEMQGSPVNIQGIARVVKESVEEASESGAVKKFLGDMRRLVAGIFRVIGKIVGSVFVFGSFAAMIGLTIGVGVIATNWNAPYNDFPLRGVVSETLLVVGLVAGFVAILIPLMSIFALGIRLVSKRVIFPSVVAFSLVGIWALAFSAGGTVAIKVMGEYFEHTRTNPAYQQESHIVEVPPFNKVGVYNERVTIKSGPVQEVRVEGRALDLDNSVIEVKDGVLTVKEKDEYGRLCIFCEDASPDIIITTPDLEAVFVENGTVWFDDYADKNLSIELFYGTIRGKLIVPELQLKADGGHMRAAILSDAFTLDAENLSAELDGTVENATFTLYQSSIEGQSLTISNATLNTRDSSGSLHIVGTLKQTEDNSSHFRITGTSEEAR